MTDRERDRDRDRDKERDRENLRYDKPDRNKRKGTLEPEPRETMAKRVKLAPGEIKRISRDELNSKWIEQEMYIDSLEDQLSKFRLSIKQLESKVQEGTRRENVLGMRLSAKEHELHELGSQVEYLKRSQSTLTTNQSSPHLVDPAVNLLFQKMKQELTDLKARYEQAQEDLSAWKFTPNSATGKKLVLKCRQLIQENEELGKQLSEGRVARLEAQLMLQKNNIEKMKNNREELNEVILQLDEELEAFQSTILSLESQKHDKAKTQSKSSKASKT